METATESSDHQRAPTASSDLELHISVAPINPSSPSPSTSSLTSSLPVVPSTRRPRRRKRLSTRRLGNQNATNPRPPCPICHRRVRGPVVVYQRHVEACFDSLESASADENIIDHPAANLPPDVLGGVVSNVSGGGNDPADVDVEQTEEEVFGRVQFSESDVIPFVSIEDPTESEDRIALRRAMVPTTSSRNDVDLRTRFSYRLRRSRGRLNLLEESDEEEDDDDDVEDENDRGGKLPRMSSTMKTFKSKTSQTSPHEGGVETEAANTIAFLKARLKKIEAVAGPTSDSALRNQPSSFRCLICMDLYQSPLVSVICWHVHCENCWLRVLGVKKLCPQCNSITNPSHLRKIFI